MLHYHPKSLVTNHLFTMSSSYSILLMVKNQELGPQATIPCFFLQPSRYSNSFSIHSSPLAKLFLDLPSGFAKPQKSLRGGLASRRWKPTETRKKLVTRSGHVFFFPYFRKANCWEADASIFLWRVSLNAVLSISVLHTKFCMNSNLKQYMQ